jgi:hypothetical protein
LRRSFDECRDEIIARLLPVSAKAGSAKSFLNGAPGTLLQLVLVK